MGHGCGGGGSVGAWGYAHKLATSAASVLRARRWSAPRSLAHTSGASASCGRACDTSCGASMRALGLTPVVCVARRVCRGARCASHACGHVGQARCGLAWWVVVMCKRQFANNSVMRAGDDSVWWAARRVRRPTAHRTAQCDGGVRCHTHTRTCSWMLGTPRCKHTAGTSLSALRIVVAPHCKHTNRLSWRVTNAVIGAGVGS